MDYLTALFISTSIQLQLPPNLLEAICYVESRHTIESIHYNDGDSHSIGICQLKLIAARQVGFKGQEIDLLVPKTNIFWAGKFLKYQINRYNNNYARAITAYNRGKSTGDGNSLYFRKVSNEWSKFTNTSYAKNP